MLVRFDSYNDNVVYDFAQGRFLDQRESRGLKGTLPFSVTTTIKKLKPATRISRKIGEQWIGTQKVNMVFLLASYLLKTGKTRLAVFLKKSEKNYIFVEITVAQTTVNASYKWVTDTPQDFLALEGKSYDAILGEPKVATEILDWVKMAKEFSTTAKPLYIAIVLVVIAGFVVGGLYMFGVIGAKPPPPRKTAAELEKENPPLSTGETKILSLLLTQEMLQEYKHVVDSLDQTPDIAMKSATIRINPQGSHEIQGNLTVIYESIYPYPGAKQAGDLFTMQDEKKVTKKREDISIASPLVEAAKKARLGALETLIDSGNVATRDDNGWKFSVIIEKDYSAVAKMLNSIYMSPVVINSLVIDETSARGDFFLCSL
ncbi:MAG: hypothetical protein M0P30_10550 [Syntrophorhabdaceae bacterium]|nr:hypothetical protein [Syntrophorhabdaceae bacterium]